MRIAAAKGDMSMLSNAGAQAALNSREKLLKSAEVLFASKGFREVSVREIAAHAGVNSALVGYYFRGKQALFNEVYRSHSAPVANERLKRLAEITAKNRRPSVEEVLRAWIIPWLRVGKEARDQALDVRLTANLSEERWEHSSKASPLARRMHTAFTNVLHDCIPFVSKDTLLWRLQFLMGAITFGLRVPGPLRAYSNGRCDPQDLEELFEQIIPFVVGGFTAPDPSLPNDSKRDGV